VGSDRRVVQIAAALGREFGYDLLRAVCGLDESMLRNELAKLLESGLVFEGGRPPGARYTFKHALIQDAAYGSLVKKSRLEFHRRIAGDLESDFPAVAESQPEVLAHHHGEAGDAERAIPYWLKAGQRAQAGWANLEAVCHLRSGLELASTLPPSPDRDRTELGFRLLLCGSLMSVNGYASPDVEEQNGRARSARASGSGCRCFT
jgi:predicted ATPase